MANTTETEKAKHGTLVRRCSCENQFQDKTYGNGNRVANLCHKGKSSKCTVCEKVV